MLNKSALTFFVTTALALFTAAYPSVTTDSFGTVLIKKKITLTSDDGIFNSDRAAFSMVRTNNKHVRNLNNGIQNLNLEDGGDGNILASLPVATSSGSEPLTDQQSGLEWTGNVNIGGKRFTVDFDTGSSDLWIPSEECKVNCDKKNKYKPNPRTSRRRHGNFSIQYGDGSTVEGTVFSDIVILGGIKIKNQIFAAANKLSSLFKDSPEDGILGMAFKSISNLNATTVFANAVLDGLLSSPIFAFSLSTSGSELHLGGTNPKHFTGKIETHHVVNTKNAHEPMFWQIANASIMVGGKKVVTGMQTIIDSGTTLIIGPTNEVAELYANIPGSKKLNSPAGFYAYPCNSTPNVGFTWGGKEWTISNDIFNTGQIAQGSPLCAGAIAAQDLPFGNGVWLLGDSFMRNVYTVFNISAPSVGFAQLTTRPT